MLQKANGDNELLECDLSLVQVSVFMAEQCLVRARVWVICVTLIYLLPSVVFEVCITF